MMTLMNLPHEIRVQVLYHLHHEETRYGPRDLKTFMDNLELIDTVYGIEDSRQRFKQVVGYLVRRSQLSSQLLRCSRKLHDEASKILYGTQPLRFNQIYNNWRPLLRGLSLKKMPDDAVISTIPVSPRRSDLYFRHIKQLDIQVILAQPNHGTNHGSHSLDEQRKLKDCINQIVQHGTLKKISTSMNSIDSKRWDWHEVLDDLKYNHLSSCEVRLRAIDGMFWVASRPTTHRKFHVLWIECEAWTDFSTLQQLTVTEHYNLLGRAVYLDLISRPTFGSQIKNLASRCHWNRDRDDLQWSICFPE